MSEAHSDYVYHWTFGYLAALTVVEIIVAIVVSRPVWLKGLLLVILALWKAAWVAMYFMHLRFERKTLGVIAITPLLICVFLVFMLTPDLGAVPHKTAVPAQQTTGAKH